MAIFNSYVKLPEGSGFRSQPCLIARLWTNKSVGGDVSRIGRGKGTIDEMISLQVVKILQGI